MIPPRSKIDVPVLQQTAPRTMYAPTHSNHSVERRGEWRAVLQGSAASKQQTHDPPAPWCTHALGVSNGVACNAHLATADTAERELPLDAARGFAHAQGVRRGPKEGPANNFLTGRRSDWSRLAFRPVRIFWEKRHQNRLQSRATARADLGLPKGYARVFFTLNRFFYSSTSSIPSVRADSSS